MNLGIQTGRNLDETNEYEEKAQEKRKGCKWQRSDHFIYFFFVF